MKKHDLLEVVIKLLGLYCFILFAREIMNFPMIYIFFMVNSDSSISNIITTVLAGINSLAPLLLSYVFVRKTDMILKLLGLSAQEEEEDAKNIGVSTWGQLSFWIIIMGLYFFISSAPYVASYLIVSVLSLDLSSDQQVRVVYNSGQYILSQVFMLGLSLFFIFKNQYIENLLSSMNPKDANE